MLAKPRLLRANPVAVARRVMTKSRYYSDSFILWHERSRQHWELPEGFLHQLALSNPQHHNSFTYRSPLAHIDNHY
jgi:hypothetical protein